MPTNPEPAADWYEAGCARDCSEQHTYELGRCALSTSAPPEPTISVGRVEMEADGHPGIVLRSIPLSAWDALITVAKWVSRGKSFALDADPAIAPCYPDASARRALGALHDAGLLTAPAVVSSPPATDRVTLREQVAAAMREHYLCTNRNEADADGNMPCRCGDWREPGTEVDDENDWDSHLADAVLAVLPGDGRAALEGAADIAEEVAEKLRAHHEFERSNGALDVMTELRRMADEAQPERSDVGPSARAGLRDQIVNALGQITTVPPIAHRRAQADNVLAVLYRAWPWLRAEAEDAAAVGARQPDTETPAAFTAAELVTALRGAGAERDKVEQAALDRVRTIVRRLAAHAVGFQDVLDESDRGPWGRTVGADIAELCAALDAQPELRLPHHTVNEEEQPEPDLADRLEAALTERFTELGNPFSEMRRHEQGPDGWPASHPVGPAKVAEVLRELLDAAAGGAGGVADETAGETREGDHG